MTFVTHPPGRHLARLDNVEAGTKIAFAKDELTGRIALGHGAVGDKLQLGLGEV